MKKIIAGLIVSIAAMLMSVSAYAITSGDWEFQLLDDEVTITDYIGDDTEVVIPETIMGATVTKVGWKGDGGLREVTSIEFPATIKSVKYPYYYVSSALETVILHEGVEEIADGAFRNCRNLKNINIPSTVKKIGKQAFEDCSSLQSIELPEGIEEIGSYAFIGSGLKKIDLSGCTNLSILEWNSETFYKCESLESVILPPNIKEIPRSMCYGCINLKYVEIPAGVEKIEVYAFFNCKSLTSVILPYSLKKIDLQAFWQTGLKEVVIPSGTTEIGSGAFGRCESLQSVYIPDSVTSLSGGVIDNSPNAIIYCSAGSKAAEICKKNSISYLTDKSVNSGITVLYNGTRISFHTSDQNPELINNRTLVPLRAIFEAMDADVEWDQETKTVTSKRGKVTIKLTIGENQMYKNGEAINVDVPAQIINDRTMIPVRVIAEAFGAKVSWNGNGRTVIIEE